MNKSIKKRFRIRTRKLVLTYSLPICSSLFDTALAHFNSVFGCRFYYFFKTAVSKGENTQVLHVYLSFDSVKAIYSYKKLCLSLNGQKFHPTYRSVRGCDKDNVVNIINVNPLVGLHKTNLAFELTKEFDLIFKNNKGLKQVASAYIKFGFAEATDILKKQYPALLGEWNKHHKKWCGFFLFCTDFKK